MIARTSGAVQGIMFLLILPLSFGSNTFVPTDTMPGWLQAFVKVNPISQLVSTVRALMIGGPVVPHLWWTLLWMFGLLVVFFPLAVRAYRRRACHLPDAFPAGALTRGRRPERCPGGRAPPRPRQCRGPE